MNSEQQRFDFMVERDGMEEALGFAERTMKIYRSAVLQSRKTGHTKPHHASLPEYRRGFIESYCYLKKMVLMKEKLIQHSE